VYSGTNAGVLKCHDAKTGARHSQQRLTRESAAFTASPVAGDGKIYCTAEEGDVIVARAGPTFEGIVRGFGCVMRADARPS